MPTYRLMLHGWGRRPDGEFLGFYAGREVVAGDEGEAVRQVERALAQDWAGPSSDLGTLEASGVISVWRRPWLAWRSLPNAGHTLYDDDPDAKVAALKIEAKVSALPRAERRRLLGDLESA